MPNKLSFNTSDTTRRKLSAAQEKQIAAMYADLAKQAQDKIKQLEQFDTVSAALQKRRLQDLIEGLTASHKDISAKVGATIEDNMSAAAGAVVTDNKAFLKSIGLDIKGAYAHVPDDIVKTIASGSLYEGDWSLSKALWLQNKKVASDINAIVAAGLAENKSSLEIAKALEQYVDPKVKKPWDWSKVYPGTSQKIDYNAQRLARTLVSHAYQHAIVQTVKPNPFVSGIRWRSAEIHGRTCQICKDRNGKVFPKDDLPLDHPNGLCTFIAEIKDSMTDIADRLADWVKGKPDSALDEWSKILYKGR